MPDPTMNDDTYCLDLVRRFDRDRYLTALLAPADRRADLLALYAFNVEVAGTAERVHEPMIGLIRLQWWRDTLDGFAEGRVREHPVARGLAQAFARHGLPREPFERLLAARERDLDALPPPSLAALEDYAEATSAALVEIALLILGAGAAAPAGRHVGIAWALTGLLRAVPYHASQQRQYLPHDLMCDAGVSADTLFAGRAGPVLRPVVEAVAARARQHLAAARAARAGVSRAALPALLKARLADVHLGRLERVGHDPFAPAFQAPLPSAALRLVWGRALRRY